MAKLGDDLEQVIFDRIAQAVGGLVKGATFPDGEFLRKSNLITGLVISVPNWLKE